MTQRKPRNWPSITGSGADRATEAFRRLEDMTRLISDWVFETDSEGRIEYVSERIIDRLGKHPIHVIGQELTSLGQFVRNGHAPIPSPDLRKPFRDVEFVAQDNDGRARHFNVASLPRFDHDTGDFTGATGIAKDVSELVQAERSNTRLADAIEMLSGYFALFDEDDRLVISNARFREFSRSVIADWGPGHSFEALLRAEVDAGRYPEAVGNEADWIRRRLARRQRTSGPFEVRIKGERWLFIDEEKLPDGSRVMMARDITESKRASEALEASAKQHREFSSSVAHRLRTPLATLRSNLDHLGNDRNISSLKHEVDVLSRMVEQMLTLTRYENLVVGPGTHVDLRQMTIDVIASLAPLAIKEGRELELRGETKPVLVCGNIGALEHAIRNLIENAIKYSARGSTVVTQLWTEPGRIEVIDEGRGIPDEVRNTLFEKFASADRRGAGAGLGLNIVKAVADAHRAELKLEKNPRGGSIFSLGFPPIETIS